MKIDILLVVIQDVLFQEGKKKKKRALGFMEEKEEWYSGS